MVQLFYTTYISVDLALHEIFHAKVGKGGIKADIPWYKYYFSWNKIVHYGSCST